MSLQSLLINLILKIYQYANAKLKLWSGVSCAERYFCDVWELFPDWSFMRFHDILEEAARQLIRTKLNLIPLTTPGLIYKVCAIVSGQVFNYFCLFVQPKTLSFSRPFCSPAGFWTLPGRNFRQWILHPAIAKGLSVLPVGDGVTDTSFTLWSSRGGATED